MLQLLQPPMQTLTTLQPTPSTIRFTVSTRAAPTTRKAVFAHYVALVLRALIGTFAILAVFAKKELAGGKGGLLARALDERREEWLASTLERIPWLYILPVAAGVVWLALRRGYTEESLLVLHGLGLQTSTTSSIYLRAATTRFIPTTSIQDVFIHEAFRGFEVRYYLAVVVDGEAEVVVVFPRLLPGREVVESVWRGARRALYHGGVRARTEEEKN